VWRRQKLTSHQYPCVYSPHSLKPTVARRLTCAKLADKDIYIVDAKVGLLGRRDSRLVEEDAGAGREEHIALVLVADADADRRGVVPRVIQEAALGRAVIGAGEAEFAGGASQLAGRDGVGGAEGALEAVLEPDGAAGPRRDDALRAADREIEGDLKVAKVLAVVGVGPRPKERVVDVKDDGKNVGRLVQLHAELVTGAAAALPVADGTGRDHPHIGRLPGIDDSSGHGHSWEGEGEKELHRDGWYEY
jgi:hypothetical protein